MKADQVLKTLGQKLVAPPGFALEGGKIKVDENFQTAMPRVYAGGDCVAIGEDLTVTSVQHGKLAARAIFRAIFPGKPVPFLNPSANPQDDGISSAKGDRPKYIGEGAARG